MPCAAHSKSPIALRTGERGVGFLAMIDRIRKPARLGVLVIGSVSRDQDRGARHEAGRPGGVVIHAGLAHAALGAVVRVVTRVRASDAGRLLAPLRGVGVAVRAHPSRLTTTCVNDYSGPVDLHELAACSDPIRLGDVPVAWRAPHVVQLGPLHPRDVALEVVDGIGGLRGLDLQGLLRGRTRALSAAWQAALARCHVVQMNEHDAAHVLAGDTLERFRERAGMRELVLTRGARGAVVVTAHRRIVIPARPVVVRYPTGAGDVFLAAYLRARAARLLPERAGRLAARIAAAKLASGWDDALG
jgi:ribokinase